MKSIFGYFDSEEQTEPAYDPGLPIECPFCHASVDRGQSIVTISFVAQEKRLRDKSFFYRSHRYCYDSAAPDTITTLEGSIVFGLTSLTTPQTGKN